jgi:signal transduction histidine kinase
MKVRARLTAWYAALLALTVAALAWFVVARLEGDLTRAVDDRLDVAAQRIAHGDFQAVSAAALPAGAGAQIVQGGRVVAHAGDPVAARPLPAVATARLAGEEYRLRAVPLAGGRRLVVAQSLDATQDAADRVLTLFLLAGPALLALTLAAGWWLAGKALRPLDESLARQRRLIGDASHELRSPLAAMRSELDVALDDPALAADAREVLASAREEVDRLTAIVRDLLTLAAADEGRLGSRRAVVDLQELAQAAAARLAAPGVPVVVAGEPARVAGDRAGLERALGNLVDNAVKASPPGEPVTVTTWRADGTAGVTVADRGPGVPEPARELVFERFSRLDAARGRDGGSGLGLAICRELVQAHGGEVTCAGSAFSIRLPAAP